MKSVSKDRKPLTPVMEDDAWQQIHQFNNDNSFDKVINITIK